MFFNIDKDEGRKIGGWVAPDNPSSAPKIIIRIPDEEDLTITATIHRPDVRELGVHSTGFVGFVIDENIVPDLANVADIELLEAESGVLIYRRPQKNHLQKKFFLFDCSLRPLENVARLSRENYTLTYHSCERYALETMLVLIDNKLAKSIFMSGRSNYSRYSHFLGNAGFETAALLSDPFEEMAQRLIFLKLIQKSNSQHLLPQLFTGLSSLTEFVRDLPFDDTKGMLAKFRQLSDEQREALASPMTKVFGANFDEYPVRRHVTSALENLASMSLVGIRSRFDQFASQLQGIIGRDILGDRPPALHASIRSLADRLSSLGLVADLLEHDLALYSFVEESVEAALADENQLIGRDTQTI